MALREMVAFGRTCLFKIRLGNTGIIVHSQTQVLNAYIDVSLFAAENFPDF